MLSFIGFAVKVTTGCDSGGRCDWMQPDRLYTAFFFFFFSFLFVKVRPLVATNMALFLLRLSSQSEGLNVFLHYISLSFLPLTLVHYLV